MASECPAQEGRAGCCRVEAVVSIDPRGQLVLPKAVRERAGLGAGSRLAVTTVERDGAVCCILLTPADALATAVRSALRAAADPGGGPSEGRMKSDREIRQEVRRRYGERATGGGSCCRDRSPCPTGPTLPSCRSGYTDEDLARIPEGADLGLGCGHPTAFADLRPGEVVLDLGSGTGIDCFLASHAVGDRGRVIGVDMTPEMLDRSRALAAREQIDNVEFRLGEIEHLPVADRSVDVIISNCVVNLSPDKPQVFREAFRVLRPGGRMLVSDIVLVRDLPEAVRDSLDAYAGCVAGAARREEYLEAIADAGFAEVHVVQETATPVPPSDGPPVRLWIDGRPAGAEEIEGSAIDAVASAVRSITVRAVRPPNRSDSDPRDYPSP